MTPADPMLSVVVPLKDEADNLVPLTDRLRVVLSQVTSRWEVVLVDDGSRDETYARALALNYSDPRFKIVRLSRNFGHQIALSAGLDVARGDAVVTLDGDLQHPPEVIPELVRRWQEGAQVVYGTMTERQGASRLKDATARIFYRTLASLTDINVPSAAGDFRLVDRAALDAFLSMREANRYLRGMFSWVGFDQVGVPYTSPDRKSVV